MPVDPTVNAEQRRRQIVLAAGRLFSQYGVAGTSVRQIADVVGIGAGSLYHHFPSKFAIASELMLNTVLDHGREYARLHDAQLGALERLHQLITVTLEVAARHPFGAEVFLREQPNLDQLPEHQAIRQALERNEVLWAQMTQQGIDEGVFRADLGVPVIIRTINEMVWLTVRWNRDTLPERHRELAEELFVLITEGYATTELPVGPQPLARVTTAPVASVSDKAERDQAARILAAAGALFVRQGVAATTIREIAAELGVVSGGLYYYYPSKESIASAILHSYLDDLAAEYATCLNPQAPILAQTRELVRSSLRVAARHPWATEIYQNEAPTLSVLPDRDEVLHKRDQIQDHWRRLIAAGVRSGDFRADVDVDRFRWLFRELTWLTVRWNRATLVAEHDSLAEEVLSMFLAGFCVKPSRQP